MEKAISTYFAGIIEQAKNNFENVETDIDISPERAILRLKAKYKKYRIVATELKSPIYRKYNYYILEIDFVVAGFDNAPDIRAIKLKYNKIPASDSEKAVPHLHLSNKTELLLTDEIYFHDFINWIKSNLPE